jgi:hypothetical protein
MWISWWIVWVVMFMFLVPPIGYGWGYRGWGPPYPSYYQRRRHQQALAMNGPSGYDHYSWSWGGDLIWLMFMVGACWAIALLWHR